MKNPELYNRTVDILVDAYFKDALVSDDCTACACGNIISANLNYKRVSFQDRDYWMDEAGNYLYPSWLNTVRTPSREYFWEKKKQILELENFNGDSKKEILST